MLKKIIKCVMCNKNFEHIVLHRFVKSKRFCDSCALKRRRVMTAVWCENISTGMPVGRPKKKIIIEKLPVSNMVWDQSLEFGGLL